MGHWGEFGTPTNSLVPRRFATAAKRKDVEGFAVGRFWVSRSRISCICSCFFHAALRNLRRLHYSNWKQSSRLSFSLSLKAFLCCIGLQRRYVSGSKVECRASSAKMAVHCAANPEVQKAEPTMIQSGCVNKFDVLLIINNQRYCFTTATNARPGIRVQ